MKYFITLLAGFQLIINMFFLPYSWAQEEMPGASRLLHKRSLASSFIWHAESATKKQKTESLPDYSQEQLEDEFFAAIIKHAENPTETSSRIILSLTSKLKNCNCIDIWEDTPLHKAANYGLWDAAYVLLLKGANLQAKNIFGDTPLHSAIYRGHHHLISLMAPYASKNFPVNADSMDVLEFADHQDHKHEVDSHFKGNDRLLADTLLANINPKTVFNIANNHEQRNQTAIDVIIDRGLIHALDNQLHRNHIYYNSIRNDGHCLIYSLITSQKHDQKTKEQILEKLLIFGFTPIQAASTESHDHPSPIEAAVTHKHWDLALLLTNHGAVRKFTRKHLPILKKLLTTCLNPSSLPPENITQAQFFVGMQIFSKIVEILNQFQEAETRRDIDKKLLKATGFDYGTYEEVLQTIAQTYPITYQLKPYALDRPATQIVKAQSSVKELPLTSDPHFELAPTFVPARALAATSTLTISRTESLDSLQQPQQQEAKEELQNISSQPSLPQADQAPARTTSRRENPLDLAINIPATRLEGFPGISWKYTPFGQGEDGLFSRTYHSTSRMLSKRKYQEADDEEATTLDRENELRVTRFQSLEKILSENRQSSSARWTELTIPLGVKEKRPYIASNSLTVKMHTYQTTVLKHLHFIMAGREQPQHIYCPHSLYPQQESLLFFVVTRQEYETKHLAELPAGYGLVILENANDQSINARRFAALRAAYELLQNSSTIKTIGFSDDNVIAVHGTPKQFFAKALTPLTLNRENYVFPFYSENIVNQWSSRDEKFANGKFLLLSASILASMRPEDIPLLLPMADLFYQDIFMIWALKKGWNATFLNDKNIGIYRRAPSDQHASHAYFCQKAEAVADDSLSAEKQFAPVNAWLNLNLSSLSEQDKNIHRGIIGHIKAVLKGQEGNLAKARDILKEGRLPELQQRLQSSKQVGAPYFPNLPSIMRQPLEVSTKDVTRPKLWDHQKQALESLAALFDQQNVYSSYINAPTGSGKSRIIVEFVEKALATPHWSEDKRSVAIVVPNRALATQMHDNIVSLSPFTLKLYLVNIHTSTSEQYSFSESLLAANSSFLENGQHVVIFVEDSFQLFLNHHPHLVKKFFLFIIDEMHESSKKTLENIEKIAKPSFTHIDSRQALPQMSSEEEKSIESSYDEDSIKELEASIEDTDDEEFIKELEASILLNSDFFADGQFRLVVGFSATPTPETSKYFSKKPCYRLKLSEAVAKGIVRDWQATNIKGWQNKITKSNFDNHYEELTEFIVKNIQEMKAKGDAIKSGYKPRGIIYVPSIAVANRLVGTLKEVGIGAAAVHSQDVNCAQHQKAFHESNKIEVLVAVRMLTTGFDSHVDYVIIARKVSSKQEGQQILGRILRKGTASPFADGYIYNYGKYNYSKTWADSL